MRSLPSTSVDIMHVVYAGKIALIFSFGKPLKRELQLFYKTGRLRVVISTANLISYDWRDMENVRPVY